MVYQNIQVSRGRVRHLHLLACAVGATVPFVWNLPIYTYGAKSMQGGGVKRWQEPHSVLRLVGSCILFYI